MWTWNQGFHPVGQVTADRDASVWRPAIQTVVVDPDKSCAVAPGQENSGLACTQGQGQFLPRRENHCPVSRGSTQDGERTSGEDLDEVIDQVRGHEPCPAGLGREDLQAAFMGQDPSLGRGGEGFGILSHHDQSGSCPIRIQ